MKNLLLIILFSIITSSCVSTDEIFSNNKLKLDMSKSDFEDVFLNSSIFEDPLIPGSSSEFYSESEVEIIRRPSPVKRVRSASFSEVSMTGGMTSEDSASPVFHLGSAFRIARENSYELGGLEEKGTPLKESRRIYRSHRTMRIALIEASRRFEEQTKGKLVREKSDSVGSDEQSGLISATLTMWKKRNSKPLPCVHSLGSSGEEDESVNVDKQEKKERKKRIRVMSDITGFGLSLAK